MEILTEDVTVIGLIVEIVLVLSIFIEITPIKINPISKLVEWAGKKMNTRLMERFDEIDEKVDSLDKAVDSIRKDTDEDRATNCRTRILQFGDEVRRGTLHSADSFEQILADIDEYESYCTEHPDFKNNRTELTQEKIREVYKKCIDDDSFI